MTRQSTGFLGILLLAVVVPALSRDLYMMPEKFVVQSASVTHPRSSPASAWTGTHVIFEIL